MKPLRKAALVADDVSLSYGAGVVLHRLQLTVEPGELFALLGPSGSGKSSLLRVIAGFQMPSQGRILIDGKDITCTPAAQRGVGMVFQSYALWPHLNVRDNVAFGLIEQRLAPDAVAARVRSMLSLIGLRDYETRMPATLSGGQQQRVALARTLVTEPKVLLLDEPFSNLDHRLRLQMRQELRRIQTELGITTIFVTHDQEEAMTIADRVAVLQAGVLQQTGSPAALFDYPSNRFVAEFVGSANVLQGEVLDAPSGLVRFRVPNVGILSIPNSLLFSAHPGESLMVFRPHQVDIRVMDEQVGADRVWLRGKIDAREFMGEFSRYSVEVGGALLMADQAHYAGIGMFPIGMAVQIGIDPHQVRFLRA